MEEPALSLSAFLESPSETLFRFDVVASNSAISINVPSFELRRGGTAVLGLNGAGKSTFLAAVRFAAVSQGVPVTLVPQNARLPGTFRCKELLEYLGSLRGMGRASRQDRALELLHLVELQESANTRVSKLSGGMHQRLLVAQGMMASQRDRLLLLDEPTVSLDERQAQAVWRALGLAAKERAVLVSSHESSQALTEMEHVVWMDRGDVVGPLASAPLRARARADGVLVADIFDEEWKGQR